MENIQMEQNKFIQIWQYKFRLKLWVSNIVKKKNYEYQTVSI